MSKLTVVIFHPDAERSLRKLLKRYRHAIDDVAPLIDQLKRGETP